jgi:serine/threonine-protein kinase
LNCPICDHQNSDFNVRCADCGAALPESSITTVVATHPGLSLALADTVAPEDAELPGSVATHPVNVRGPEGAVSAEPVAPAPPSAGIRRGDAFGRFLIVDRLGEGAMGVVLAAHDPNLDRKVAIKVLRPGPRRSDRDRARLVREAQAMAKLSHLNVVAVHEVGVAGDQVFVVMEHVVGRTLRAWLAEQPRSLREIVDLFLQAGRGLAAAHQAGFVHRDFKPDNVIVGDDGRARVTDFGLASVIEGVEGRGAGGVEAEGARQADAEGAAARPNQRPAPLTSTGAVLGTPAYMAPEQHEGRAVDARADQFAFAVALYEALYGDRPFAGKTYEDLRAAVLAGAPREAPRQARVPAWLRAVLLRGLRVDPDERYPSMDALLAALEKDPVAARWRAARIVGIAAVAGLAIVGLVRGSTRDARVCEGAEERLAPAWNESVKRVVRGAMLATGRPGAEDTYQRVERIFDERARSWAAMYTESCEATNVRGEQSAALLDLRTQCLDRRLKEMGALAAIFARGPDPAVLDRAVQSLLSLPDLEVCADASALSAAIPPPADPSARARIDALRGRLGEAEALYVAGKYKEGLPAASALAEEAKATQYTPLEAEALALRGRFERAGGDAKSAEATFREVIPLAARARDDDLVARSWSDLLFAVGMDQTRYADALALRPAAEAAVARIGEGAGASGLVIKTLGMLLVAKGEYAEGIRYLERAVAAIERASGPDHPQVASALLSLGSALDDVERYEDARKRYERALAIFEKNFGPEHPRVGGALNNLGQVLREMEKLDEAWACIERALAIDEKALGPEHPDVAMIVTSLANVAFARGRVDEARRLHERALAIRQKVFGPEHPNVATSLSSLGNVADASERWAEAQSYEERALAIREKAFGPDHISVARTLSNLGTVLSHQGKPDEARKRHERAMAIHERALGPDAIALVGILTGLGEDDVLLRQPEKAITPLERAVAIGESKMSAGNPELAWARFTLARALWDASRDRGRALALAEQARGAYAGKEGFTRKLGRVEAWLKERAPLPR